MMQPKNPAGLHCHDDLVGLFQAYGNVYLVRWNKRKSARYALRWRGHEEGFYEHVAQEVDRRVNDFFIHGGWSGNNPLQTEESRRKTTFTYVLKSDVAWEYVGQSPFNMITPDDRMTVEQVEDIWPIYVPCGYCLRRVTSAAHASTGYHPGCAKTLKRARQYERS